MPDSVEITKDEALAAVREASWAKQIATCGHTGCEDHIGDGPRYIHCYSSFGMDMPMESAEDEIRKALKVGWSDHWFNHNLVVVTADERVHRYDVKRPANA